MAINKNAASQCSQLAVSSERGVSADRAGVYATFSAIECECQSTRGCDLFARRRLWHIGKWRFVVAYYCVMVYDFFRHFFAYLYFFKFLLLLLLLFAIAFCLVAGKVVTYDVCISFHLIAFYVFNLVLWHQKKKEEKKKRKLQQHKQQ